MSIRPDIIAWISNEILPHETEIRRRLRAGGVPVRDEDDIIQEAYCRISMLADISHIRSGRAYFHITARNILLEQLRQSRVVSLKSMAEWEDFPFPDEAPGPEQEASGRQELERVRRLVTALPERCRAVFTMARFQNLPQREIARRLGITENVVEKLTAQGLRTILKRLGRDTGIPGRAEPARGDNGTERSRQRKPRVNNGG